MSGTDRISVEEARRILAVSADADAGTLRAAFNKAAKACHPDHGGRDEDLRRTLEAYRVLEAWLAVKTAPKAETDSRQGVRLEITPVIAVSGGRTVTRLPDGRKVALTLPAGLRNGDKVSAAGEVLSVFIRGRPELFVSGDDLCLTVKVGAALLREGGRVKIKTPFGQRMVWVPKQVGTNRIVRVLGHGLPAQGKHAQGAMILKLVLDKKIKETPSRSKLRRFSSDWAAA